MKSDGRGGILNVRLPAFFQVFSLPLLMRLAAKDCFSGQNAMMLTCFFHCVTFRKEKRLCWFGWLNASEKGGRKRIADQVAIHTALNMAMRIISVIVKDRGILVVNIHPGWVKTDMGEATAPEEVHDAVTDIFQLLSQLSEIHHGTLIEKGGTAIPF
ncbi:uncharacterized protein NPIL_325351 [Nephila pilipes]|uniref:C-factor n=1 Tax=Nephila pilipes TaxID=299642 RepID=A0A8X6MUF3_NEPPI|nr:uncharacterized protein NPIL_325351 [Nephila pilipes]